MSKIPFASVWSSIDGCQCIVIHELWDWMMGEASTSCVRNGAAMDYIAEKNIVKDGLLFYKKPKYLFEPLIRKKVFLSLLLDYDKYAIKIHMRLFLGIDIVSYLKQRRILDS